MWPALFEFEAVGPADFLVWGLHIWYGVALGLTVVVLWKILRALRAAHPSAPPVDWDEINLALSGYALNKVFGTPGPFEHDTWEDTPPTSCSCRGCVADCPCEWAGYGECSHGPTAREFPARCQHQPQQCWPKSG